MPCARVMSASDSWLPITAAMSTSSSPDATRPSRSYRQCPAFETSTTARRRSPVSLTCQLDSAERSAATSPNRARSSAASNGSESARTTWRVKNQPVSGSVW